MHQGLHTVTRLYKQLHSTSRVAKRTVTAGIPIAETGIRPFVAEGSMSTNRKGLIVFWVVTAMAAPPLAIAQNRYVAVTTKGEITRPVLSELWREPKDIKSENLFYGPGGEAHLPHGPFSFLKEDLDGTSPKYDVRDADGVKWKIKLGAEVRPETAATRLVWSIGYHTDEDYFLPEAVVNDLPAHIHRGRKFIEPGGVIRNVRLKRVSGEKKEDNWNWRDNPFVGTHELDGLRVMMAVINNWDLKNVNNAVRELKRPNGETERIYEVSDVGASFGRDGIGFSHDKSKGNLHAYEHSKFFRKVDPELVSFDVPARPNLFDIFTPRDYFMRLHLRWIGRDISREDAHWVGQMLGQLSSDQVRDAFRAAGYSNGEIDGFSAVVQQRIKELQGL
jgi:hypothetical protein